MRFGSTTSAFVCICCFVAFILGCGPQQAPVSDQKQAKELATRLLDAWVAGKTFEDASKVTPPVVVYEDLWKRGVKLTAYEIVGDTEMQGSNVRVKVTLKFVNKEGKPTERTVYYLVTTTPALTFFREDG